MAPAPDQRTITQAKVEEEWGEEEEWAEWGEVEEWAEEEEGVLGRQGRSRAGDDDSPL